MTIFTLRNLKRLLVIAGMLALLLANELVQAQTPAATCAKVLATRQLEVNEAKMIKRVEAAPPTFVLGIKQLDALRTAGGSDVLVEAV